MLKKRVLFVGVLLVVLMLSLVPTPVSAETPPEPVVAIHFSEYTQALDMPDAWWHYFVMPESLKEALDSDGTPWVEVSDADIRAGRLLHPDGSAKYPILISLASEAVHDDEVDALRDYVAAGGFLFAGSSSFTLDQSGASRGDFALADEMGLHMVSPYHADNWAQNRQFTKVMEHRLVWHIPSGTLTWRMPLDSTRPSWSNGDHYVWQVSADDAEVVANGGAGPLLATREYGAGRFIYHGALNPLIGHGGNDSGMYAYLIYRNAIEWAFEAAGLPIVKLSPWRYEHDAAFVIRHDFENTPSRIRSIEASAQAEAAAGAQGDYYFCTGTLRVGSEDTGIPESEKPDVIASVQRAVSQYGATIGSHNGGLPNPVGSYDPTDYGYWHWGPDTVLDVDPATLPPTYADGYEYAYTSILTSFLDIEGWLDGLDNGRPGCGAVGDCPRTWVSPYFNSGREGSYDILQELDSVTMGEQKLSPFPHWTLSYDSPERHTHVTLPPSDWYIGDHIAQSMEAGHNNSTIHALVDFYHDLGTLINLYSHQSSAGGRAHEYLTYGMSKPRTWTTNAVGVYDWWVSRSGVEVTPAFSQVGNRVTAVATVTGAADPETAIELVIPHWDTGAIRDLQVLLDGAAADPAEYRTTDNGVKVKVGTTVSTVEVGYTSLEGWVQTDWDGGPGQAEWADETRYDSATGVDDSVDGQVRLSVVAGGDVMFSDDFTRPPDPPDPLAPWVEEMGTWSVTDGAIQAAGTSGYSYVYTSTAPAWTDYSVEGRIQFPAGAYGGGIGGRVDPGTGAHYGAWVYPGSNMLRLVKFRDWTHWNGQAMGGDVSLPGVGTDWHTLKLDFVGNRIRVYYDGNPVLDVTDENYDGRPAYLSGGVSVDTWGGSTVAIAADDIVVGSPAEYGESGTLMSSAFDGGKGVQWQDISWQAAAGGSTDVRVRTRTADQADQLAAASWSDWYAASGSPVTSEDRRWIQYQVELTSGDPTNTPVFYEIGIVYAAGPGHLLSYTGPTDGESEAQVVLSATQLDDDDNPVVGRAIRFQLDGLEPVTGTTNASGVASAPFDLMIAPGQYGLTVAFDGDEQFGPASVDVPFEVTSPWSEWIQDTEADFQGDTLSSVDASTDPGSVLLDGTLIGEGEETGPFYLPGQTPRQGNWMQTDWVGGPGQGEWADETRYDSATGIDDDVAGQARLSVVSGGDVLFFDDFTRPDPVPFSWILPDTSSSGWPNSGRFDTAGGVLNAETDPGDYGFAYTDTVTIDDHSVEADIRFPSRTSISGGGIYGRLNPATGQRYAFWIYPEMSPGGSATVRIIRFNDWGGWTGLAQGSIAGGVGTDWHHMELTLDGNQIAVYYDGGTSPLVTATDGSYTSGHVGVGYWNSSGAGSAGPTYNNFVVRDGEGQIVFGDDFGPDLGDPLNPWVEQLGTWEVTDGALQGSSSPGTYGYVYTDTAWADYSVEGRVQFPDGAYGGGLGGRLNPSTGAHYAAWLYPDTNELKLAKFSGWTTWTPLVELSDVPDIGTSWHTLKLDFQGNRIRIYYDGELAVDHVDSSGPYLSGGVSTDLWTPSGFSGTYGVQADDVIVRAPAEYGSGGTLLSSAFDGGENAEWQTIAWDAEAGSGTDVRVRTRTAAQMSQLAGAPWSGWYTGGGAAVTGGDNRWIQYEVELTSDDPGVTPILHEITSTYTLSGADEWSYRRKVTIDNNSAEELAQGYSIKLELDTAELVGAGKLRPDGDDLRVVWNDGGTLVELDRVAETAFNAPDTEIWFQTQAPIPAHTRDASYTIYYGNPFAGLPPADPSGVWALWDGFDGTEVDTVTWEPTGSVSVSGGEAHLAAGGNLFGRTALTNALIEVRLRLSAQNQAYCAWWGWEEIPSNADNMLIYEENTSGLQAWMRKDGGAYEHTDLSAPDRTNWHTYTIRWWDGNAIWLIDGAPFITRTEGIPTAGMYANLNARSVGIDVDYVKARLDAAVEPTVSLATPWMGFVEEGQVLSVPYDTGQFSEWKYLTWEATTPPSTTVGLRLRTAATAEGLSAAPWIAYGESGLLVGADNEHPNDAGRWVQYEATLTSTDPYTTPALHQVTVYYTGHPATLTVGLSPETVLAGEASTCTASVDDGEHTWDVTGETDFNIVEGGHGGAWASDVYTSAVAGDWTVQGEYAGLSGTNVLHVDPVANLSVVKTSSAEIVSVGSPLTYTVTVTNEGPSAASSVTVTDELPAGVSLVSATSSGGSCSGTDTVICGLGDLVPGADGSATLVVTVTEAGQIANGAVASGEDVYGNPVTGTGTVDVDAVAPMLAIVKDGPAAAQVGETAVYTFTVSNDAVNGDGTAIRGVSVSDDVAGDATYVSGDVEADGLLEVGETWVFTASHTIVLEDPDPLVNTGTAVGEDLGGGTVLATDTHSTGLGFVPVLAIVKDGPATAQVGETVVYTFTVTNDAVAGDGSPVSDVSVSDDVAGDATYVSGDDGSDGVLEVGETWVFIASHTIVLEDPDPLVNTGTAVAKDLDEGTIRATDVHTTALSFVPVLAIVKDGPATAQVDETVVYTFTVVNDAVAGDGSPVSDVSVSDDVAGDATYVSGDDGADGVLEVGETWLFTASYTVQESDPDPLVNTGTVTGRDRGGAMVSASDTHSTEIAQLGPTLHTIFLPCVMRVRRGEAVAPDLVVERITVTGDSAQVVIKNQGLEPVTADTPFWVDLYVNPHPVPTMVNQTWDALCSEGMVWGVGGTALPLEPGEELTLTYGDAYYWSEHSAFSGSFAAGMPVYVQVDSANADTTHGAVLESHEIAGGTYNNISGPVYPTAAAGGAAVATESPDAGDAPTGSFHGLPPRP